MQNKFRNTNIKGYLADDEASHSGEGSLKETDKEKHLPSPNTNPLFFFPDQGERRFTPAVITCAVGDYIHAMRDYIQASRDFESAEQFKKGDLTDEY